MTAMIFYSDNFSDFSVFYANSLEEMKNILSKEANIEMSLNDIIIFQMKKDFTLLPDGKIILIEPSFKN